MRNSPNHAINTDSKKRRAFVAPLFAAGYGDRYALSTVMWLRYDTGVEKDRPVWLVRPFSVGELCLACQTRDLRPACYARGERSCVILFSMSFSLGDVVRH